MIRTICNIVDEYVLDSNFGIMYDKVFKSIMKLSPDIKTVINTDNHSFEIYNSKLFQGVIKSLFN
jgi:hypothetical protein